MIFILIIPLSVDATSSLSNVLISMNEPTSISILTKAVNHLCLSSFGKSLLYNDCNNLTSPPTGEFCFSVGLTNTYVSGTTVIAETYDASIQNTIVKPSGLKNWPDIPDKNPSGANTTTVVSVEPKTDDPIVLLALSAARQ